MQIDQIGSDRGGKIPLSLHKNNPIEQCEATCTNLRPALFLDRDGTLNIDNGYTYRPSELHWVDGAKELIKYANTCNYYVFVVTNQSGVARGFYTEEDVLEFHKEMQNQLSAIGAHIDHIEFCPYHIDGAIPEYAIDSDSRKPNPGMIIKLLDEWPVDAYNSLIIGDSLSDVEAGRAAGIKAFLFDGGNLYDFFKRNCV